MIDERSEIGLRRSPLRLRPDPRRVITKMFVPGLEGFDHETCRTQAVLSRLIALDDAEVEEAFEDISLRFAGRHRDLLGTFRRHAAEIAHRLGPNHALSEARFLLLGAAFTSEYSIEGAALCNPSVVAHPDQTGVPAGALRLLLSVRAIGEGHRSSIEFRTGTVDGRGQVQIDAPPRFATTGTVTTIADRSYAVSFPEEIPIAERVLWPAFPFESNGMEDARFVRFTHHDGEVTYYASYTGYDGNSIKQQLLETTDFRTFRSSPVGGPAAANKGLALFPRRVGGRYVALSRFDRETNSVAFADDPLEWNVTVPCQVPARAWEVLQLGNCGSPIETEAGWLVLTHGVGPMRTYCIGALLLDLEDPTRILGELRHPLLSPTAEEQDGYVPNVVYSCGALVHGGTLVLPYGIADAAIGVATVPLDNLLAALTDPTGR